MSYGYIKAIPGEFGARRLLLMTSEDLGEVLGAALDAADSDPDAVVRVAKLGKTGVTGPIIAAFGPNGLIDLPGGRS